MLPREPGDPQVWPGTGGAASEWPVFPEPPDRAAESQWPLRQEHGAILSVETEAQVHAVSLKKPVSCD